MVLVIDFVVVCCVFFFFFGCGYGLILMGCGGLNLVCCKGCGLILVGVVIAVVAGGLVDFGFLAMVVVGGF